MSEETQKSKSSYKKLFSNTIIFAIGQFSSKILVLLLVPIYTYAMTDAEFGITDVIIQMANWLVPIVSLAVAEAITRYGLDKDYDKASVFTIGNIANIGGLLLLGIVIPFISGTSFIHRFIDNYSVLLYIYVATSSLKLLYSYFVRALEMIKLYAFCSIFTTFSTLILTVLFLLVLKIGVTGYLLAIIISDLASIVFLIYAAKLWRFINFKKLDLSLAKQMLKYCIPLIPAQLLWLITNSSNSFLTTYFLGQERNGILSASYKIPNIVSTVYMIFGMAWNMSAITEKDKTDQERFYKNVFDSNQSVLYIVSAFILLVVTPVTNFWIGPAFRESVKYAPILIFATIFTCYVTFFGTIYSVAQRSVRSLVTSLIAGVINVLLNVTLLPVIGLYAAAISTLASYFVVFIIRAVDTQKYQKFDLRLEKLITNCILLILMVLANYIGYTYIKYTSLIILFMIVFLLNYRCLFKVAKTVLPQKVLKFLPFIK